MAERTAEQGRRIEEAGGESRAAVSQGPRETATAVGRRLITGVREHDVSGLSAEMAYRFLFALFPFGLFVAALGGGVAGWLGVDNPAEQIIGGLGDNLPPAIAEQLQPELERLFATASNGLLWTGALLALWAATGGTNALVKGIHRAYDVPEQRPVPAPLCDRDRPDTARGDRRHRLVRDDRWWGDDHAGDCGSVSGSEPRHSRWSSSSAGRPFSRC